MLRLILLCILVTSVYSLSCPCWEEEDKTKYCPPTPTNCPIGLTLGPCGCCLECYKDKGEACGGPWGVLGECGEGLRCEKGFDDLGNDYYYANHKEGVCQPIEPTGLL
uniref:Venom protein n=1 Tax=Hadrurus spadix TaxID=141984 RepID=A0A1W7R956_9SCOR